MRFACFKYFTVTTVCSQGAQKKENCWLELPWNTVLPPAGPSVPSAGHPPPASPWNTTNNLSIVAPGQLPTEPKHCPQIPSDKWDPPQQATHSITTNSAAFCVYDQHALCSLCGHACLTCAAPGSASPGPASCPAGDWAPVWAVSLTSAAPTPAGSASSDHSGSDFACGSPAPDASSGSLPAQTDGHTQAFSVAALVDSYFHYGLLISIKINAHHKIPESKVSSPHCLKNLT